jgi:transposase
MTRYIGVDLHTNSLTACYLEEGKKIHFKTYQLTPAALRCFMQSLQLSDELAVEATGNTEFFIEAISEAVSRIVIVNSREFKVIRNSVNKTDKNDARALAYFLSKDMLPEARRKSKQHQKVGSLSQTRDKFVKSRTYFMNKVHGILNSCGIKLKKESLGTEKGLQRVLTHQIDEVSKFEVEVLVDQIRVLNGSIKKLDNKLVDVGSQLKGHRNLVSIKGIGDRSAAILLSAIGDVNDFENESKLFAYFGIVPRVSNSNETERSGRITKRGTKLGRTTLVQCTLIAIRYSKYLRKFYDKLKAKKGSGKAIIATSKKMLSIIYKTLKYNWVFEDFENFVLAER